jgi:predicted tellurium resistance membrane protein TerC
MVFGSQLILKAMERFNWLVYLGSAVLAWAAANMITNEEFIADWLSQYSGLEAVIKIVLVALVLFLGYWQRSHHDQAHAE